MQDKYGVLEALVAVHDDMSRQLASSRKSALPQPKGLAPSEDSADRISELERSLSRLQTIIEMLKHDTSLIPLLDKYLGQHIQTVEAERQSQETQTQRHQWRANLWLAFGTTLLGAFLGWLISALLPTTSLFHF